MFDEETNIKEPSSGTVPSTGEMLIPLEKRTTAEPIDGESSSTLTTFPGLLERYFLKYLPIPCIIPMVVIGFIFVQDNNAGRLKDWDGITWTLYKSLIFSGIVLVLYLIPKFLKLLKILFEKICKKE